MPILTFTCQAILFDMDGTLVDSTPVVERQWRRWAALHHLNLEEILAVAHGRRTIETMRIVAPHLGLSEQDAADFDEEEGRDVDGVVPVEGARQILAGLPAAQWAVVTSAGTALARSRIDVAGLVQPAVLISADDVREGKPHPEGYRLAALRLGVDPEDCLVVEDTPAGIEAGLAAGMQVLSIGKTVPKEQLKGMPWIANFHGLRLEIRDRLEISLI